MAKTRRTTICIGSIKEALESQEKPLHLVDMPTTTDTKRWRVLVIMSNGKVRDITADLADAIGLRYDHIRKAYKGDPFCKSGQELLLRFNRVFEYTPKINLI